MATIVHTTDLGDDRVAFEHGVALAKASGATLVSLHANAPPEATEQMRDADQVLERWGADPAGVVFRKQIHTCCDDPVDTVLDGLRKLAPQLVLATTHRRSTIARLLSGSAAEALAHNLSMPVLLFPEATTGFVSVEDGAIDLHRILVAVGDEESAEAAVRAAVSLAELAGVTPIEFVLLHVGDPGTAPKVEVPSREGWSVRPLTVQAPSLEKAILDQSTEACVVVMATRGHDSVGDVLRGSHTDRVLHEARCPVLSLAV